MPDLPKQQEPQMQMQLSVPQDDHEGQMARADLYRAAKHAMKLFEMIQEGQELEGWVQAKITKSADYLDSVFHYMEYQMKFGDGARASSVDDITGEAQVAREKEVSEEDDEKMESNMNYDQKLKALLESAKKKQEEKKPAKKVAEKKPAKKEVKTDEALDMNLVKAAQKGQAGKPIGKPDAESDKNIKKKYGYRSDGEPSEKEDEVGKQDRPGRKRKTKESMVKAVIKRVVEANKPDVNKDGIPDYAQDGKGAKDLGKGKTPANKGGEKKTAKGMTAAQKKLPPGLQKAIAKKKGASESTVSAKKVMAESVELNRIKMLSGLK
jgi:hypothetical protein